MLKNRLLGVILLLYCGLLAFACTHPTSEFQRDNEKDPLNNNFNGEGIKNIKISTNSKGVITISWEDITDFEDGYIIKKSLGDSLNFNQIGKVEKNVVSFQDSSKVVKKNTFYKVTAFMETEDSTKKVGSVTDKLDFLGDITSFKHDYNPEASALSLNWTTNSPFTIKYQLKYRNGTSGPFTKIENLQSQSTNSYIDKLSDVSFKNREYKLTLFLDGNGFEQQLDQESETFKTDIFDPRDLSVEIKDEQTININWQDHSFFETGL